ncbi:MAG: hypothetical protein R2695_09355 [Acidimicrobiales bacterium]
MLEVQGVQGKAVYEAALAIIEDAKAPDSEVDADTLQQAEDEVARWELTPDALASEPAVLR